MVLTDFSKQHLPLIQNHLRQLLTFNCDDSRSLLEESIKYSVFGKSKSVRPLLVLASQSLFGKINDSILSLACVFELVHTYSLIHDDLPAMDNDDYRRGQPTNHIKFGEDIAILAGDTLSTYSFEILSQELVKAYPADISLKSISFFANSLSLYGMAGGQVLDLKGFDSKSNLTDLSKMHSLKTGALIKAALLIPAILNQSSAFVFQALETYGNHLGLLFQIVDDILDIIATKESLGKTPGKDSKQHKLTYVSLLGLEEAKSFAKNEASLARKQLKLLAEYDTDLLEEFIDYFLNRSY